MLLLGGASLAGALLTPAFAEMGSIELHFTWSLMFPMLASLAFGAVGGLTAAAAGPVLIPFLIARGAGWAAMVFSLTLLLWLGWVGFCAQRRHHAAALWNHPAIAPLPPAIMTLALYVLLYPPLLRLNPMSGWSHGAATSLPASAILAIAVKQIVSLGFALLSAHCLLKLPLVRRLLGMAAPSSHRFNSAVMGAAVVIMLLLSLTAWALDDLLVEGSRGLIHSPYELIWLVTMASVLLAGALLCCRLIEEHVAAADHLRAVEAELRCSQERFDLAMQGANDGLIDWLPQQRRLYLSPRLRSMLGYSEEELPARPGAWARLLHPDDRQKTLTRLQQALQGKADRVEMEYRAAHHDGGYRHFSARAMILRDPQQRPSRLIGTQRDVTERVEAAQRQRQAEVVFNTTLEGVLVTDPEERIIAVNPALLAVTGYDESSLIGKTVGFLDADPLQPVGSTRIRASLGRQDHWRGSVQIRRANGEVLPQWLTISAVRDQYGKPINYVGIYTDITAIRENAAQLEFLAHHDPLTNLPNRLLLKSRLNHLLESARRRNGSGAVLFIDLDFFKQVNDSLGHRFGDELLRQLVQRMRNRLRESDTLARLGGDEFVAVLEDIADPNDAALVAVNLIEQARTPFSLSGGHVAQIGCSIGISLFPDDANDAEMLLHNADLALYQAKEQGRGRYCFYNHDHAASSQRRLNSNRALGDALTSGGLLLYFQPVVSLADGKPQGVEALLRWRSPDGRLLTPDQFMPMAENTAVMTRLCDWVLREACQTMKSWIEGGLDLSSVTVNLSMHQFRMPDLPKRIDAALQESGLEPQRLELDITEAAVMPRGDDPLTKLRDLKSLGIKLALDDFGTGYSSFAMLGQYPVDKIKVDRKFVQEIEGSNGSTAAAIVAMANLLQIPVQAEGIETEWQREMLLRSRCDSGQGYLFSRPMPKDEFPVWYGNASVH
jgi:diguanylate cyclase (GGDEF)-like protein/PAS domain S-box-containing protein